MQYCNNCKVSVSTKTAQCPLCHAGLRPLDGDEPVQTYPSFEPLKEKKHLFEKIVSFCAIASIVILVVINLLTYRGHLWSVIACSYILYVWLLGLMTIKKGIHVGLKLLAHAIAIPLLLMVVNMFADSEKTIHKASWAISYTMPFIFVGFILAINILMMIKTRYLRDYLIYQLTLSVIAFVPLLLVLLNVAQPMLPSIIAAMFSFLSIIGLIIFSKKNIQTEFGRKFHI